MPGKMSPDSSAALVDFFIAPVQTIWGPQQFTWTGYRQRRASVKLPYCQENRPSVQNATARPSTRIPPSKAKTRGSPKYQQAMAPAPVPAQKAMMRFSASRISPDKRVARKPRFSRSSRPFSGSLWLPANFSSGSLRASQSTRKADAPAAASALIPAPGPGTEPRTWQDARAEALHLSRSNGR